MKHAAAALALSSLLLVAGAPRAHAQMPEDRGSYAIGTWDPGSISLDGTNIPVHVSFPMGGTGAPYPLVAVVHGASRTAANMAEMRATFASRGFVVVAPDMPCGFTGCNHAANARQIRAMLAWAVAQGATSGSMLEGLVDGTRQGVAGHSWGGLGVFLAAQGDPDIDAVVTLDPNDDAAMAMAVAGSVAQPSAHLMAQVMGACNSTNWKDTVYPYTPAPHVRLVVQGAAHCDVENPSDVLCPFACGSGNPSLNFVFRRYAVAFLSCILQGDTSMADWVGGPSFDSDVSSSVIGYTDQMGLDTLPCRMGGLPDGGLGPPPDAGSGADLGGTGTDAGGGVDAGDVDLGGPGVDAGGGTDAGTPRDGGGMDARVGADGGPIGSAGGGCCAVLPLGGAPGGALAACAALALVALRRRSRGRSMLRRRARQ